MPTADALTREPVKHCLSHIPLLEHIIERALALLVIDVLCGEFFVGGKSIEGIGTKGYWFFIEV
jgi:hypothetical protein